MFSYQLATIDAKICLKLLIINNTTPSLQIKGSHKNNMKIIKVKLLNGDNTPFYLNADKILCFTQHLSGTHIVATTGDEYFVLESPDQILEMIQGPAPTNEVYTYDEEEPAEKYGLTRDDVVLAWVGCWGSEEYRFLMPGQKWMKQPANPYEK